MKPIPRRALAGVLDQPWAIRPQWLDTIVQIAQREGEDPEALAARLGRPLERTQGVEMRDGVAVLPVLGPIFPRANLMTDLSGATSLEILARDFTAAAENDQVEQILLEVDSPGGVGFGISEMAGIVAAAGKPVTAFVAGLGASAAYWIAAAADRLVVADTAMVGSIGVVQGVAVQEGLDRDGFREFEIVSANAENKRPDPREEAGLAEIRRGLDAMEAVFVADVARFRGVTAETVIEDFGRGGVLVGAEAVAAGMADEVGTFEDLVARLAAGDFPRPPGRTTSARSVKTMPNKTKTAAELAAEHPEAVAEIKAEATKAALAARDDAAASAEQEAREAGKAEGLKAGAQAERDRIAGLKAASLKGYEALLEECIADGTSTKADLAVKIVALQQTQGSKALDGLKAAEASIGDKLPAPETSADGAGSDAVPAPPADTPEALEAQARAAWNKDAALRAELAGDFQAYLALCKAQAEGRVRVYGKKSAA